MSPSSLLQFAARLVMPLRTFSFCISRIYFIDFLGASDDVEERGFKDTLDLELALVVEVVPLEEVDLEVVVDLAEGRSELSVQGHIVFLELGAVAGHGLVGEAYLLKSAGDLVHLEGEVGVELEELLVLLAVER